MSNSNENGENIPAWLIEKDTSEMVEKIICEVVEKIICEVVEEIIGDMVARTCTQLDESRAQIEEISLLFEELLLQLETIQMWLQECGTQLNASNGLIDCLNVEAVAEVVHSTPCKAQYTRHMEGVERVEGKGRKSRARLPSTRGRG